MYNFRACEAPMMQKGTREQREFFRHISKKILLYSEMQSDLAIINSPYRDSFLKVENIESPIALQFGSSNPKTLEKALLIANEHPYIEYNLNCGCPSDRVQNNNIGAVLMKNKNLVAELLSAMKENANGRFVTLKHRIGIKSKLENLEMESYDNLAEFVDFISNKVAIDKFTVHARIAILEGLSPKENREIPPINYEFVYRLKKEFPNLLIEINGNINFNEIKTHLEKVDSVMIGRNIIDDPFGYIGLDNLLLSQNNPLKTREEVFFDFVEYLEKKDVGLDRGYLIPVFGLFRGISNASKFREKLSGKLPNLSSPQLLREAYKTAFTHT